MKRLFILVCFIGVAMVSCQSPQTSQGAAEANEKLVKQYFDYFNAHQWNEMAAMYADSADFKDPSLGTGIVKQSITQIAEKYAGLQEAFPDVHDKVLSIYPSGEKHMIVEFVSTGTAPDGSKFELPICTIFTFENGKIISDFTYYDNFEE